MDSVAAYFQDIRRVSRNLDPNDPECLITQNLPFVITVAKRYRGRGLSMEDLIAEGNAGLVEAAKRFDNTRGVKFISYAVWWIRQSMISAILAKEMVRVPTNRIKAQWKACRTTCRLAQTLGREPFVDEVEGVVDEVRQRCVSLDDPTGEHGSTTFGDLLVDLNHETPETMFFRTRMEQELRMAMTQLPAREAEVVRLYFGLGSAEHTRCQPRARASKDPPGLVLEEIGQRMGFSRERARQIREVALKKLRKMVQKGQMRGPWGSAVMSPQISSPIAN